MTFSLIVLLRPREKQVPKTSDAATMWPLLTWRPIEITIKKIKVLREEELNFATNNLFKVFPRKKMRGR